MLNTLLYFFASGLSFFPGSAMLLVAVAAPLWAQNRRGRRWLAYLGGLGAILIACSTTPLPHWFYGLWLAAILFCPMAISYCGNVAQKIAMGLAAAWTAIALGCELPFAVTPSIPTPDSELVVVGDSISAGVGGEKRTWTDILESERAFRVINLSRAGATAKSALNQVASIASPESPVLLEIGGNDLLSDAAPAEFERDLSILLQRLTTPARTVAMLELPLFPTRMAYGQIQRRLAKKYNVLLIPKRRFAWVLLSPEGTSDGLHLSDRGHQRMAQLVGDLFDGSD
jgi:acyl-CoA thioesterase-1